MKETTDYLVSFKHSQWTLFFSFWVISGLGLKFDLMSLFGTVLAVTGKLWPKLYQIKLRAVDGRADGSVEKLCPKASFYRWRVYHGIYTGRANMGLNLLNRMMRRMWRCEYTHVWFGTSLSYTHELVEVGIVVGFYFKKMNISYSCKLL